MLSMRILPHAVGLDRVGAGADYRSRTTYTVKISIVVQNGRPIRATRQSFELAAAL